MSGVLSAVVRSKTIWQRYPRAKNHFENFGVVVDGYRVNTDPAQSAKYDRVRSDASQRGPQISDVSRLFYDAGYGRSH
jgi:hypothetical protein